MKQLLFVIVMFSILSLQTPQRKRITDKDFRYEFYTTDKKVNVHQKRIYYWFKGGAIHTSEAGMAGELLDGAFQKYYLDNQLCESGAFDKGLKTGTWKMWFSNGNLQTVHKWKNGQKHGKFSSYGSSGQMEESGFYSRGEKDGKWINYLNKDTINYNKGTVFIPVRSKFSLKKRTVKEKMMDSISKRDKKIENAAAKAKRTEAKKRKDAKRKAVKTSKAGEHGKPNILKRIFSRKEKTTNDKGK